MHIARKCLIFFALFCISISSIYPQSSEDIFDDLSRRVALALSTPDYPVTPGDTMSVSYLSATGSTTMRFSIDADYSADLGFFGSIDVKNLTYLEMQRRIADMVKAVYPNSFPKVMLLSTGSFRVTIDGAVQKAGEVEAWGLTRLSDIIHDRIHAYGNERSVAVREISGIRRVYDLFMARRDGVIGQNPYVSPGDRITVGESQRRVTIAGEVKRPGSYELLSSDTLFSLIDRYGDGLTDQGDQERIIITRYDSEGESAVQTINVDLATDSAFSLKNEDAVTVSSITDRLQVVYLEGAVNLPKDTSEESVTAADEDTQKSERVRITLRDGDTLYSVLSRSRDRIRDDADLRRAVISRSSSIDPIELDMEALLYQKNFSIDVTLIAGDRIVIPFGAVEVFVTGEVVHSEWVTVSPLTRLSTLLLERTTDYASDRDVTITSVSGNEQTYDLFRARRNGEQDQDPYLEPGDTVTVSRALRMVTINGEIERPGTYILQSGEQLGDLIAVYGGGFTALADAEQIKISRYPGGNENPATVTYIDGNVATRYPLRNLDRVEVPSSLRLLPVVYLDGAVTGGSKKRIQLKSGDTLYTILRSAQDQISPSADLTKGFINREGRSAPIEVDMERLLFRYSNDLDVRLVAGDLIVIPYGDIEVFLKGEVTAAQWIKIDPLTRLSSLISGHMTEYASNRDIVVQSETGDEREYDLFRASRLGEKEQNPYLQSGDTIIVGRAERKVTVSGQIERPGTYQLLPGEKLDDLISFYGGGFTMLADRKDIRITKYSSDPKSPSTVTLIDGTTPEYHVATLNNLDQVMISSSLRYLPVVYLEGAVYTDEDLAIEPTVETDIENPSSQRVRITFRDGDTLYETLRASQQYIKPDSDLSKAFINREGYPEPIEIDMERLLYRYDENFDIALSPGDRIVIPFGDIEVFLKGEVIASRWINIEPLTRLSELVDDHLTAYSSNRDIEVITASGDISHYDLFRAERMGEKEQDPYLRSGDTIVVQRSERIVTVTGQIERPGTYQPLEGESLGSLIEYYGGGFTTLADRSEIRITRYTGDPSTPSVVETVDSEDTSYGNFVLYNLDRIEVTSTLRRLPVVYLDGAVTGGNMRRIQLRDGDTLYSVLSSAKEDISESADLSRGFISREGLSDPIEIDLERLIYRYERDLDIQLQEGDRIVVPYGNLQVFLKGEVISAQWINIEPLTRLSSLVGGRITEYSSIRDISVLSTNGDQKKYDLFVASRSGDKTQDPYLESGDTVEIGRVNKKVALEGEVERPGIYQILPGETLDDLLSFYGNGFTADADPAGIEIVSYVNDGTAITRKQYIDLEEDSADRITLADRDIVTVPSSLRLLPYVFFEGAVSPKQTEDEATSLEGSSQFRYRFHSGELLSEALENNNGRFSPEADLQNGYIIRQSGESVSVNMEELLRRERSAVDIELMPYDRIIVPFKQYFVIVAGAVKNPGRYPYIPNRTYRYYVDLAGGFDSNLHIGSTVYIKDISDKNARMRDFIDPEMKITAPINNPLYYLNQLTGVLSIVGTAVSFIGTLIALDIITFPEQPATQPGE